MKTRPSIAALSLLLTLAAIPCFGEMMIERVTIDRAKQLDIQLQANPAGHDALRIVLDFPTTGDLTCWDRVPEKQKQSLQATYAALVVEKDATFDFKLTDPDPKFVDRDRTEEGVTYRMNLPVTRQLNMKAIDPGDKKTLFVLTFAV